MLPVRQKSGEEHPTDTPLKWNNNTEKRSRHHEGLAPLKVLAPNFYIAPVLTNYIAAKQPLSPFLPRPPRIVGKGL